MKKSICLICVLMILMLMGNVAAVAEELSEGGSRETAQADSVSYWGYGTHNDEFGDPIEGAGFVLNTRYLEGTFSNSATYNSPLWANVMKDQYGFSFWFFEYQNESMLYRNSYSVYDKIYTVKIKDEGGTVHTFYGFMFVGDCYLRIVDNKAVYDRIYYLDDIQENDYDDIMALFMTEQVLKVSISAESGSDSFSFTIDTRGFAEAYGRTVSPLKVYTDKATIKAAQTALNEAGYDCGTPDGIAGKGTAGAVTQYQTDMGLTVTGTITHETLISLGVIG